MVDKVKTSDFSKLAWDPKTNNAQLEYVKERCCKIRKRNNSLLVRLMNLREKMVSQMYMCKIPNKAKSLEASQLNEKIRDMKYQISHKLNKLRIRKMDNELSES